MADKEGERFFGRELGGHDQIALVLAILVIDDHDDLAAADRRYCVLDGREDASAVVGFFRVRPIECGRCFVSCHGPSQNWPNDRRCRASLGFRRI